MSRLAGITTLYAVVATLAIAAPLSASPEPATPAPSAAAQAGAPATDTTAAPAPAQPPAPAAPPAQPAPAPAQPAPQVQAGPAQAAPAAPAQPADVPHLRDTATLGKPKASAAASTTVGIKDFAFGPSSVTVNVGDTVTWSNSGPTGHSATANDGSFDTGILPKGKSGSHTFSKAGTFSYICKPHPFMKGTVIVKAASAGGGSDNGSGSNGSSGSSGTAGSSGSSGSSSSGSTGTGSSGSGSSLPNTGFDAGGIALLGLTTLLLGAYLHRRARAETARPAGRIGW
jgi:LPXTG-motif cell wall-anchored protein